jgi:DNA (cytosine-5)-methyltransferase 1
MDIGFEIGNLFSVVWTNEIDLSIGKLYAEGMSAWRGFPSQIKNQTSVDELSPDVILGEAFPSNRPDTFGIIGGPPCPDFSIRGSHKGFEGKRGRLTTVFTERILSIKPTFFVIENVKGVISPRNRPVLNEMLQELRKLFIVTNPITLNALDFGVPQHRERVFIIGFNREQVTDERAAQYVQNELLQRRTHPNALRSYRWPRSSNSTDIKKELPPDELCVGKYLIADEASVANADEYFLLRSSLKKVESISEGDMRRSSFRRLHRQQFSPTTCYGNNEVHIHPYLHRRLSVREALRLQSVPDNYTFTTKGNCSKKFKLIGNGVPVTLAQSLAEAVFETLQTFHAKGELQNTESLIKDVGVGQLSLY